MIEKAIGQGKKAAEKILSSGALKLCVLVILLGVPLAAHFFLGIGLVQDAIISLGGKLAGRPLDGDVWRQRFNELGSPYFSPCIALFNPAFLLACTLWCTWLCHKKRPEQAERADGIVLGLLFAAYLVVTAMSVLTHEPWFDELHAWEIAKYSIAGIFREMGYEGHFMPWFILLYPFAHTGFPPITMNIIAWLINAGAMLFFIRKAPFSVYIKILVMFTAPFLYIYPVLARPYVLIPPLLFLIADAFPRAGKRPVWYCALLALMANTHLYMEGFALAAFIVFAYRDIVLPWGSLTQRQKLRLGAACMVAVLGALFAFLQILPAFTRSAIPTSPSLHLSYAGAFFTKLDIRAPVLQVAALLLIALALFCSFRLQVAAAVVTAAGMLYMLMFCTVFYSAGSLHRASLWFFMLLFAAWTCAVPSGGTNRLPCRKILAATIACLSLMLFQPYRNSSDYNEDFAGIRPICSYIKKNIGSTAPIFTTEDAALAYLTDGYTLYDLYSYPPAKIQTMSFDREKSSARAATMDSSIGLYAYIDKILGSGAYGHTIYIFAYLWDDAGEVEAIRSIEERSGGRYAHKVLYPASGKLYEGFNLIEISSGAD